MTPVVTEISVAGRVRDRLAVLRRQSLRHGFLPTFATEGLVLTVSVAVIKLAAHRFPETEFAYYLIARRAVALAAATILMGMGIAVPRYVALECQDDEIRALQYLAASILLLACTFAPLLLGITLFPDKVAHLVFGKGARTDLIFAGAWFVAGFSLHTLVYGYFRGHMRMAFANTLQFLALVVAPPVAIVAAGPHASRALTGLGLFMIALSLAAAVAIFAGTGFRIPLTSGFWTCCRNLVVYGAPRIVGEFAWFGLFAIPAFIIGNKLGTESAGAFSFGLSIMQLITGLFTTVGLLLLPYVARLFAKREVGAIASIVTMTLRYAVVASIVLVLAGQWVLPWAVDFFSAGRYVRNIVTLRWLLATAVPAIVYVALRQPLDAITARPINSANVSLALLVTVGLTALFVPGANPGMLLALGFTVLAALTLAAWNWQFRPLQERQPD